MRPLVVIAPGGVYMDVLGTYRSRTCVVRPNFELNERNLSQREILYAYRYIAQEGWVEYVSRQWKPDPELTRFMDESLGG
jgi:hypothetical protein